MLDRQTLVRMGIFVTALVLSAASAPAADQVATSYPPVIQGEPLTVALEKTGARFIAGRFQNTLDFNPGTGEDSKTSGGGFDVFVTRFEADGSYAWTKTFGGSLIDFPKSLVLIGKTLYVGGTFASANAGVGGGGSFACKGLRDVFVWAMDAKTGNSVATFGAGGIQTFGGAGTDNLQTMIAAGANLLLAGNFDSTDAGVGGAGTIQAAHALDCYALMLNAKTGKAEPKFGTDGAVVFGGVDVDEVASAALAGSTLFLTGNFKSLDFSYEGQSLFAPIGIRSAFVLAISTKDGKLNPKFGTAGAIRFGGASDDRGLKLAVAGSSLYLAGNLMSANAGLNAAGTFASRGMNDAYVLALSAKDGKPNPKFGTGGFQQFGGSMEDTLAGMVAAKSIYLTGTTESTNAPLGAAVTAAHVAKKDIFVLALNPKDGTLVSKNAFSFALFGGSEDETASDIVAAKKAVFVSGSFNSTNAGYGAAGAQNFTNFGGLLLPFDIATGVMPVAKP